MSDRTEIEAHFLKAAVAFEKCGFISVRSFKTKQPRGHKNIAALSTKKAAIRTKFQSRSPL
jgi:hypothetical protein